MPKHLQARLLRVLQERRVSPLGAGKEVDVDVAIVSATHKNLKDMIARSDFREDLYYRLNGLVVRLPALRERTDFDLVVQKIVKSLCENGQHIGISPQVMDIFKRYHWPGNFRQLHNLLRTAVVMVGSEGVIDMTHLPDDFLEELEHGLPHPIAQRMAVPVPTTDALLQELPSVPPMPEPAVDSQKLQGRGAGRDGADAAPAQRQCVGGGQGAGRFAQHHLPQKEPATAGRPWLKQRPHAPPLRGSLPPTGADPAWGGPAPDRWSPASAWEPSGPSRPAPARARHAAH